MNMFLKGTLSFALCYVVGVLPTSAEIPNHHIFYRSDKRAPLTKIEIVFLGAGRNQEHPSQNGLAGTALWSIGEYAKKHGYMDQLATLGTELNILTSPTSLTIYVSALSENCDKSIEIVHDLIHNVAFSESNLKRVKKRMVANYQNDLRRNTSTLMKNFALSKTKGIKKLKSLKTLKNILLQDIEQYYDRLLKTEVVFFKVISDRDSTEVASYLRPLTEGRQTGGFVHALAHSATDHTFGPSAFVFNRPRAKNILSYWLIPCGRIGAEDYIPNMISKILEQDNAPGLLYTYFREELGLVYSIQCDYRASEDVRFLEISADPQLHNSEELMKKMSEFLLQLPAKPRYWEGSKDRREFYAAHAYHLTPQQSLDNEVYHAIYNPPIREDGYKSVTVAEVRAFLEKYFVSQNLIMIFVGPKDHIIDILNTQWPEADIHVQSVQSLIE